ncbi:MAG: hypothetical protein K2O93_07410 [Oscillospiraceae bacterium]|nr:hypothetical protein [Oscillospiraceae bacterium]
MKKNRKLWMGLAMALSLSLLLGLVACGSKKDDTPDDSQQGTVQPSEPEQPKDDQPEAPEEEKDDQPGADREEASPLKDFYTTLQAKYEGLDAMMVIEGELLETYYPGLSEIAAVEEIYLQETMITTANVAVGMVKLSEDATLEDITAVQEILQARITTQAEGGAWYPESCETWKNGIITSVSNTVGMFVYPEQAQELADAFTEAFSN